MHDYVDTRSAIELEPISKPAIKRKYDNNEDQTLNAEYLERNQKRSSFQGDIRRPSREAKININSNISDDEDDLDNIVVIKDLEALQTTCND